MKLRKSHKILIGLIILALGYLGYSYFSLRQGLFGVYDIPEKYTYKTSPDADLMVVDFNKFSCIHCRELHPILMEAIARDGKIIYVPFTLAFEDDWGKTINAAIYAAAEQDKFIDLFNAVYDQWPVEDAEKLVQVAGGVGLDIKKLTHDMSDPKILAKVAENDQSYINWGFLSVPVLLIGKQQLWQYSGRLPTVTELLDKFNETRNARL